MKKSTILITLALTVMMTGCNDGEYRGNQNIPAKTKGGYTLYGFAMTTISDITMLVAEMEMINTYIGSDSTDRASIQKNEPWFSNKTIVQNGADSTVWRISSPTGYTWDITLTNTILLSDVGAKWSIRCSTPYMAIKNSPLTMERTEANRLTVRTTDGWTREEYAFRFNNLELSFTCDNSSSPFLMSKNPRTYGIDGTIQCTALGDDMMTMGIEATSLGGTVAADNNSYRYDASIYFWTGKIVAVAKKSNKIESITGDIKDYDCLFITYKNVTEKYDLSVTGFSFKR